MIKVNYRSKYWTENYGLDHFGKITFQRIQLWKNVSKFLWFNMQNCEFNLWFEKMEKITIFHWWKHDDSTVKLKPPWIWYFIYKIWAFSLGNILLWTEKEALALFLCLLLIICFDKFYQLYSFSI